MKTLIFSGMLMALALCSIGQDKQSKPKNGIEVNLQTGQLLEDIPIDQTITLYGALPDSTVLSGRFSIYRVNGEDDFTWLESGDLKILDKKTFHGYVDYFFRANATYKIYFTYKKDLPPKFRAFVQRRLIEYYHQVFHIAGASGGSVQTDEIISARDQLVANISQKSKEFNLNSANLTKVDGLLDADVDQLAKKMIGSIQVFSSFDQKIQKIDSVSKIIHVLLKEFANSDNMAILIRKYPAVVVDNFRQINNSEEFAVLVGSGRLRLSQVKNSPPADILNLTKPQLDSLIKNIAANIAQIEEFEGDCEFKVGSLYFKIYSEMNMVSAYYDSILLELENLQAATQTLVSESIQEQIEVEYSTITTVSGNFETTARWYVSADVGVALLNLAKNTDVNPNATNDSWKLLPYLGINISPVPVNKKNSIRTLMQHNYKWYMALLKVSSFGLGVTMSTLDNEKYKGIFNIDNPRGLLTGFGIRPIPQIKVSFGGIWYNRRNGNTLTDSYNITCRPYLSASLDWDLRNLLPSIKSLFN
ncbi:hypothetical protein L0663_04980 [Dyadobacter sp. CY107]|uniref:hypothetical protein n=1 Tax=Dyadobacter fanqingshengii TaxID=2906443 RepID=UPI001F2ECB05|nr:hypothetical protein [Dyadobacter fanqingshengii]MCF2502720.1 hypothetical protein [Dyadobacter fanqingshengii]